MEAMVVRDFVQPLLGNKFFTLAVGVVAHLLLLQRLYLV
jgi:hypothetical protein